MLETRDMAKEVTDWAKKAENVRVVLLTSTRANPHGQIDVLSDYDITLYVRDMQPFLEEDKWPETFGEVLVREPYKPKFWDDGSGCCMVIFKNAPRVDFNVLLLEVLEQDMKTDGGYPNDMGYEILLDKDGLIQRTIPPTYSEYWTKQPTESEYEELVHHFWWNITYVAKCLFRDELFFAKYMLDGGLHHHYLKSAIAWYIGMQKNWKNNPGANGRWFKKHLDPQIWSEIEATFAGADLEENWKAMFKTAEIFGRLASDVGDHLGYSYPFELERNVTQFLTETRDLEAAQLG